MAKKYQSSYHKAKIRLHAPNSQSAPMIQLPIQATRAPVGERATHHSGLPGVTRIDGSTGGSTLLPQGFSHIKQMKSKRNAQTIPQDKKSDISDRTK